ncbi:hypothetical protein HDU98_005113, partial [Podochytrium sp. JEL0797]
ELCEFADFFKSYQSGVHASDGKCTGFLVDAFASHGDSFTSFSLISHGGGKARSSSAPADPSLQSQTAFRLSTDFTLTENQSLQDRSIRTLIAAKNAMSPVVVIMGS